MDLAGELQARLTDEMLTKFLVDNVVKDRGATNRLATAFQTLVPDPSKQQDILAAAGEQAAALFKDDPQFESVWTSSTRNADVVLGREVRVRGLRARADDGADAGGGGREDRRRPAGAHSRLARRRSATNEIRALDQQLLLDLLKIETRPDAWSGVLDTAIANIDQLVLVGDLTLAVAAARGGRRDLEGRQRRRLPRRPRPASPSWSKARWCATSRCSCRTPPTPSSASPRRCARTIGPVLVKPMSDALMGEDNARTVRRLRDILISFGPAAREYANELKSSRNPAVRRAAIDLLRGLGRRRGAARSARHARRSGLAGAARSAARHRPGRHQRGVPDARAGAEERRRAHARGDHAGARRVPRREGRAAVRLHPDATPTTRASTKAIYTQTIESLGKVALDERSVVDA